MPPEHRYWTLYSISRHSAMYLDHWFQSGNVTGNLRSAERWMTIMNSFGGTESGGLKRGGTWVLVLAWEDFRSLFIGFQWTVWHSTTSTRLFSLEKESLYSPTIQPSSRHDRRVYKLSCWGSSKVSQILPSFPSQTQMEPAQSGARPYWHAAIGVPYIQIQSPLKKRFG